MDKLDAAVKRLQSASDMSLYLYKKPLLLTYSGGKDSDACIEVAKIAGIPFEVVHSHTTADAPETVHHVRAKFHRLELDGIHCEIVYPYYKGKRTSMWDLIPRKLIKEYPFHELDRDEIGEVIYDVIMDRILAPRKEAQP